MTEHSEADKEAAEKYSMETYQTFVSGKPAVDAMAVQAFLAGVSHARKPNQEMEELERLGNGLSVSDPTLNKIKWGSVMREEAKEYVECDIGDARVHRLFGFTAGFEKCLEKIVAPLQERVKNLEDRLRVSERRTQKIGKVQGQPVDSEHVKELLLDKIPKLEEERFTLQSQLTAANERIAELETHLGLRNDGASFESRLQATTRLLELAEESAKDWKDAFDSLANYIPEEFGDERKYAVRKVMEYMERKKKCRASNRAEIRKEKP